MCFTYGYATGSAVTQCTWAGSPVSVQYVPHAFGGGFPVAAAGPGQVALWTGEFATEATDVTVATPGGSLSISRSHSTFAGPHDAVTGVFGPGWSARLDGTQAGAAGLSVLDNTTVDGTIALADGQGTALVYRQPGGTRVQDKPGVYTPVDEDTRFAAAGLEVAGTGPDLRLTLTEPDGTRTTWSPVGYTAGTPTQWGPVSVVEPAQAGATTFTRDGAGRVVRVLAPVPAGVDCPATGPLDPGCRALRIDYATASTATATAPGDVAGQVRAVWYDGFDPAAPGGPGMVSVQVAGYAYDTAGRLVSVTDPRSGLSTGYGYDGSSARLATLTPPGLAAFRLGYDPAAGHRLGALTRDPATPGGAAASLARVVYDLDPGVLVAGLPDLRADSDPATTVGVEVWGQAAAPTYGAAVFGPDYTGPLPPAGADWSYAELSYTDDQGYTVNAGAFGAGQWQLGAVDYDEHGNVVRALDPAGIAAVRAAAAELGDGQSVDADAYATLTRYSPDGLDVLDQWGPARQAALADGSLGWVRPHTATGYDTGAPNGGVDPATGAAYRLPTRVSVGVAAAETATTDPAGPVPADLQTVSVTVTGYDPIDGAAPTGPTSGWTLGAPTTVTTLMPDGADITRATRYDPAGRVVETRQPDSSGADAGTTLTRYYTAGATSGDPACDDAAAWAGLVCTSGPAAAPDSGPALPVERVTGYDRWANPTEVVETSGPVTRTTATSYLPDGRVDTVSTAVAGLSGSAPVPATRSVYDPDSGLPVQIQALGADPATVAGAISTGWDDWARVVSYTDGSGAVTTTGYDPAGRVAVVTDPHGSTGYGYDGLDAAGRVERRGLPTRVTVSGLGELTGAYDAAGNLVEQLLPGGVSQTAVFDHTGARTGLGYAGPVTGTDPDSGAVSVAAGPWLGWSVEHDVAGRVAREWTPVGAAFTDGPADGTAPDVGDALSYDRAYRYDPAGRLVTVFDRTAAGTGQAAGQDPAEPGAPCSTRSYAFDGNGNRTGLSVTPAAADGSCSTATTATSTRVWAYDSADRNRVQAGYGYDPLGRAVAVPAADTPRGSQAGELAVGYYDTDTVATITQNGTSVGYTLDPAGRRAAATTTTPDQASSTLTRGYPDPSDDPGWVEHTDPAGQATLTRYAHGLGGGLAATVSSGPGGAGTAELAVADPHGDLVSTVPLPVDGTAATGITGWADHDEYGQPVTGAEPGPGAEPLGYGWLGVHQRATDTAGTGLVLMGARLYNPATGQFTSTDPVPGGGDTAYAYPTDPINMTDLDGRWWSLIKAAAKKCWSSKCYRYAGRAAKAAYNWGRTVASTRLVHFDLRARTVVVLYYRSYSHGGQRRYLKLDRADKQRNYTHWVRGRVQRNGRHRAIRHYRWYGSVVD